MHRGILSITPKPVKPLHGFLGLGHRWSQWQETEQRNVWGTPYSTPRMIGRVIIQRRQCLVCSEVQYRTQKLGLKFLSKETFSSSTSQDQPMTKARSRS
jgi:hypothetical protein